jgi:hypothetical protein
MYIIWYENRPKSRISGFSAVNEGVEILFFEYESPTPLLKGIIISFYKTYIDWFVSYIFLK